MNVFTPFSSICRGVEGSVLDVLVRSPLPLTAAEVARRAGRSKSEVWKSARRLHENGILAAMTDEGGTWYSIPSSTTVGQIIRSLGKLPFMVADTVREHLHESRVPVLCAVLASPRWAERLSHENVLIVVTPHDEDNTRFMELERRLNRAFGPGLAVLHGSRETIRRTLIDADIDWGNPHTRALHVSGTPLADVLLGER